VAFRDNKLAIQWMGSKELPWFAVNLPFAAIVLWIFSGGL